jgi:cobalt/nickel transport system permease protein
MHHSYLDKYADGESYFHRLDSRVKFLAAVIFTTAVLMSGLKTIAVLFCFAIGPFSVLVGAGIPLPFVFRRILIVSPFVLILALTCPFYDRQPETVAVGPYLFSISGGWLRCFAILGKFAVTMLTLFALVCTTRFADLLAGLGKMRCPEILVVQLGMLYRYLFVLVDRVHHILRARNTRKLRNLGFRQETAVAAAMTGALFIGSIETSQKIQTAMQARGFCGQFHSLRMMKMVLRDGYFITGVIVFIVLVQWVVKPLLEGKLS